MKKNLKKSVLALSVTATLCSTSLVMAASDPFSDVPAKHWAYEMVNKLAKDGIVNGYGDGTFRGDRMMSRFEMAMIVGNAMSKTDKATAEDKALISKLAAEFTDELKTLGKRIENVEKKQGPLTISGFAQYRYENVKNPRPLAEDKGYLAAPSHYGRATDKSNSRTAFGLILDNQFDGDTYFHGMILAETLGGRTTDTDIEVKEAFFAKKFGPNTEVAVGKFMTNVGLGTLGGAPYMDGGRLSFGKDVKVMLYSAKFGGESLMFVDPTTHQPIDPHTTLLNMPNYTFNHGDIKFDLAKDLKLSLAYLADKDKGIYNSQAVGFEYKGISDITLTAEYGKNSADTAKLANGTVGARGLVPGDAPKAYFIKAKYKGANPFVPGSSGFWVQYKKAEAGFDLMAMADPNTWNSPFNHTSPSGGGMAENIKGFEYGFETTVARRTMFKMAYNKLDRVSDSVISLANAKDQSYYTAQLTYIF